MSRLWRNLCRTTVGTRRPVVGALMLIGLAASPVCALADDAAKGEIIVKRWCAACHVVSPDQVKANSDAPTFASIAHKRQPPKKLKAFLTNPHPKMPDMNLSRSEIADIVAYIGSLDR